MGNDVANQDEREIRTEISGQFRRASESLAQSMSFVLNRMDERDMAAISVATLKGALLGAELELAVREEALTRAREITNPQSEFYLGLMETEANDNLAHIRNARKSSAA